MTQGYPLQFSWIGVKTPNRLEIESLFRDIFSATDLIVPGSSFVRETVHVVISSDEVEKDTGCSVWKITVGARWGKRWTNPGKIIQSILNQLEYPLAEFLLGAPPIDITLSPQGDSRVGPIDVNHRFILKARERVSEAPQMSYKTQPTEPFSNFAADLEALVKNYRGLLGIDYSIELYRTSELSPEHSSASPVAFSIKEDGLQIHLVVRPKTLAPEEPVAPRGETSETAPKGFMSEWLAQMGSRVSGPGVSILPERSASPNREKHTVTCEHRSPTQLVDFFRNWLQTLEASKDIPTQAALKNLDLTIPSTVMSGLANTWSQLLQSVRKVDSTQLPPEEPTSPQPQEEPGTISPEPSAFKPKTQAEIASMSEEEYREWIMKAMEDPARREAFVKAVYATTSDVSDSDPHGAIARMDGTPEELGAALNKELRGESAARTAPESVSNDPLSQGQFWVEKGDNLIPRVTTGAVTISGNYDIQFQEDGSIRISPRAAN